MQPIPSKARLVLVSFLGLFLELSLIRWFPAHIFSLSFFANIILIASFLGLGCGMLIWDNKRDLFQFFPLILFGVVVTAVFLQYIRVSILNDARTWLWSYYSGNKIAGPSLLRLSIAQVISLVFFLAMIVFVPIGQKIGRLMQGLQPLSAYTLNIAGSLLGVVIFALAAVFYAPAYLWFFVVGVITLLVNRKTPAFLFHLFLFLAVVLMVGFFEKDISWSPYYAIQTRKANDKSIAVYVNQIFHQKAVNFESEPHLYKKYNFVYRWFHPRSVLVIGAGTGNDVWIASQAGAEQIDAVEIDPLILRLGHPQRPYENKSVRVFIDDARSFMQRASHKYDMIVYGTLDSHAVLSLTSAVRLDNYVYTYEALKRAQALLEPEGVMVLLFSVPRDWMLARFLAMTASVFGRENTRYLVTDPYLFNLIIVAGGGLQPALKQNADLSRALLPLPDNLDIHIPTDNWPYLYLQQPGLPSLYLVTLLPLILISLALIIYFSPLKRQGIDFLFFFLGCGFLLLETKSVTTLSLLFGSTWVVNAVVFSFILAIALLANWLVMRQRLEKPRPFLYGLVLSLVFLYFFPSVSLLRFNFLLKVLASGILIALPIFFSSLVFALLIKKETNIGIALGSNLLGAVIGGFLEYTSLIWGLNILYIIALIFYVVAGFFLALKTCQ